MVTTNNAVKASFFTQTLTRAVLVFETKRKTMSTPACDHRPMRINICKVL